MVIVPPANAAASWNKIANKIKAAASSKATTGSNVSTNGPLALYCLMTIKVAAGAVALAIADNVKTICHDTYCGKIKWATTKAAITSTEAPKASKTVMIITLLPNAFIVAFLNDVPIEKAIKPKATELTQLILLT